MSLGVVIKGPEGLVLSADSRVTLQGLQPGGGTVPVYFDNATKLLSFARPHDYVGAVTYGTAVIGGRTAHSFIPELELPPGRVAVEEFATTLSAFFMARWQEAGMPIPAPAGPNMTFIVAGFDQEGGHDKPYGTVFVFGVPSPLKPEPRNPENNFGMTWGGQLQVASRLVHGYDPALLELARLRLELTDDQVQDLRQHLEENLEFRIPYPVLPLQDCIDLAIFLIRATAAAQNLAVGIRGVGGPIEVATITRNRGLRFVQRKRIHGEAGAENMESDYGTPAIGHERDENLSD